MDSQEYIKNLIGASKQLSDDILSNPSFEVEDLEAISNRMSDLMVQLDFWTANENLDRFCYELVCYIEWVLENYS